MPSALGFLETKGLVAAITAADAMAKAANVKILGREKTQPALITVKIMGDVAAVKTAIEAGIVAANSVGVVISSTVIPNPFFQIVDFFQTDPIVCEKSDAILLSPNQILKVEKSLKKSYSVKSVSKIDTDSEIKGLTNTLNPAITANLAQLNVHNLRKLARETDSFPIKGREISKANKSQLLLYFKEIVD